uniref:Putative citrinin biosynthesis transcriptional activator CtnR n=1 Tax=Monascus pilosus TaxID=89488 RepID=R9UMA8_MONPI|nr:putative citrinin biosynthesis transcriptional activator CtnR [Monascus pilosus]
MFSASLERRLEQQMQTALLPGDDIMNMLDEPAFTVFPSSEDQLGLPAFNITNSTRGEQCQEEQLLDHFADMKASEFTGTLTTTSIPELMRADLADYRRGIDRDQLYFDRVHIFTPIIHQRRYLSWSKDAHKNEARVCLQYAMWALAASFSAPFQHLRDALYRDARRMLDLLELSDGAMATYHVEQAQAWILVAIYEFMRMNYQVGWMSAGRSFRLVQLMRLYGIDGANSPTQELPQTSSMEWIETEEKRRTFWMAYTLDRFISMRDGWPLTLNEQVVTTCLPAPEAAFQSGKPASGGFLSETITQEDTGALFSFTECIIIATVCGRSLSHGQKLEVERVYGDVSPDFWQRHQWLDAIVKKRIEILSLRCASAAEVVDPLLLFTYMMAQTTVLYLCKLVKSVTWETDKLNPIVQECEQRSLAAAQEIVSLTHTLKQFNFLKVHPFTPLPLYLCAEFLSMYRSLDASFDAQLQEVQNALRNLQAVNNLARTYLNLLQLKEHEGSLRSSSEEIDL